MRSPKMLYPPTGVPPFSLSGLETKARQLRRAGLTRRQIIEAIENLHPRLMRNLAFDRHWNVQRKNSSLIWILGSQWSRRKRA